MITKENKKPTKRGAIARLAIGTGYAMKKIYDEQNN